MAGDYIRSNILYNEILTGRITSLAEIYKAISLEVNPDLLAKPAPHEPETKKII
jgi:hypothetical protein